MDKAAQLAFPPLPQAVQALADAEYKDIVDFFGYDRGRPAKVQANKIMRAAAKKGGKKGSTVASCTTTDDDPDANEEKNRIIRTGQGLFEFTGQGPPHGRFSQYASCWLQHKPDHVFRSGTQVPCACYQCIRVRCYVC